LKPNKILCLNILYQPSFGGKYAGETTGIIYNNQMDDFSSPGLSNFFSLKPSPANYIEPGKRPMSSMSPLIILDSKNEVKLVLGASGGSKIVSAVSFVSDIIISLVHIYNMWFY
jgi:gamma-glutamyltranspeptidase/glutathione hydrolase/leukotriene-C4 hydrolase